MLTTNARQDPWARQVFRVSMGSTAIQAQMGLTALMPKTCSSRRMSVEAATCALKDLVDPPGQLGEVVREECEEHEDVQDNQVKTDGLDLQETVAR